MSDAFNSCSMPISPPPVAANPSHRFIAQWADRMDVIDTSKGRKRRVWNITTSDSRKRRRFSRDSITKALKCFLLSVLFQFSFLGFLCPLFAQWLAFSIPLQRLHSLHSLCFGSDILLFCLSVCWGFRVKKLPITYRNRS